MTIHSVPVELKIPVLETNRLRLRGHKPSDFPAMVALWGDIAVTRYVGGRTFTPEEVWARYLRYIGHWCCLGYGYWVVEEKTTGDFIGEVGFASYRRDTSPSAPPSPEAGWVLASAKQGQGYATEAVQALLAWGEVRFDAEPVHCIVNQSHRASLHVAHKCGFVQRGMLEYNGHLMAVLERSWTELL